MIVLASGLTLARESSFGRQLRLLARGLRSRGRRCVVVGTGAGGRVDDGELDVPRLDAAAVSAAAGEPVNAAILLGYPDQFPLLAEPGPPLCLWAQFSRPPRAPALGRAVAVPLTEATRAFLEQAGCAAIGPTIPHAVDTALFAPAGADARRAAREALGAAPGALVVGTVGANSTRKRFDRMIEAFARLPSTFLLIIKTDRERSPGGFDLPALARRAGVDGRVRVLCEPMTDAALARFYGALDVYAHAAEWEGFCVPVAEAMACGVPVAAARTQGPGEIVPYGEGLVVEGEWLDEGGSRLFHVSPPALAAAIERVADPAIGARLAAQGQEEAARRYDARVVAGQWLALLDEGFRPRPGAL